MKKMVMLVCLLLMASCVTGCGDDVNAKEQGELVIREEDTSWNV